MAIQIGVVGLPNLIPKTFFIVFYFLTVILMHDMEDVQNDGVNADNPGNKDGGTSRYGRHIDQGVATMARNA